MKLCQAKHTAQKARKKVEVKVREEAERKRVAEEEEKRKRTLDYLQQLQDKMQEKKAALLKSTERF